MGFKTKNMPTILVPCKILYWHEMTHHQRCPWGIIYYIVNLGLVRLSKGRLG
jgi:hypothetical protein